MKHIIIVGDIISGSYVVGPFDEAEYAVDYAGEHHGGESWVSAELREPVPRYAEGVDALKTLASGDDAAGTYPLDLDEDVHDAASRMASDTNNGGIDAQVDFLVEHLGYFAAQTLINDRAKEQR